MNITIDDHGSRTKYLARLGIKPKAIHNTKDTKGTRLSLCCPPITDEANALAVQLAAEVTSLGTRSKPTKKQLRAMGVVLSDLIRVLDMGGDAYAYRSSKNASFTNQSVGRAPYDWAMTGLQRLRLVTVVKGKRRPADRSDGIATRVYPAPALRARANAAGIEPGKWSAHFKIRASYAPPIVMARSKATLTKGNYGDRIPGKEVPIDLAHPSIIADNARLPVINAYLSSANITPAGMFGGLTRIYGNADQDGFDYNQGGRLYDLVGRYQSVDSSFRSRILFDGEPSCEIDLKASHFTIYRALIGIDVDPEIDPYEIVGADRGAMKQYVCSMFGSGNFPERWSSEARDRYAEKNDGADLSKVCPAAKAKEHVLRAHPYMKDWPTSSVRWGQLQYEESCILLDAVEALMREYDCPALPVHDSIIVPRSKMALAMKVLCECFRRRLGVLPALSIK